MTRVPQTTRSDAAALQEGHPLPVPGRATPWRWAMAAAGALCLGLGVIGAFLPVMPTTVFVLIGSFLLTRSCPWLEERMLRLPVLRPYAEFVRSKEPMTSRMRWTAMAMMLGSVAVATGVLAATERLTPLTGAILAVLAAVGAVSIALFRRGRAKR